jgi:hypothetical protein
MEKVRESRRNTVIDRRLNQMIILLRKTYYTTVKIAKFQQKTHTPSKQKYNVIIIKVLLCFVQTYRYDPIGAFEVADETLGAFSKTLFFANQQTPRTYNSASSTSPTLISLNTWLY